MSGAAVRAAAAAALGGAVVGVQLSLLSGLLELPAFSAALAASTARKAALSSAYIAGAAGAALPAAPAVDALGRRRALLASAAASLVAARAMAVTRSFRVFLAARLAAGAVFAVVNIAVPMYLTEIAPTSARGQFVSLYQLAITAGVLAAQVANLRAASAAEADAEPAFRAVLALAQLPSVAMLVAVAAAAPESPAWLAANGASAAAAAVRRRLQAPDGRQDPGGSDGEDVERLVGKGGEDSGSDGGGDGADVEAPLLARGESESGGGGGGAVSKARPPDIGFVDMLRDASARRRLSIAIGVQVGQQLTGVNSVIFYAPTLLKSGGAWPPEYAKTGPFIAAACIGSFLFMATCASLAVVERFGRKTLLLTMAVPMTASLIALTAASIGGAHALVSLLAILVFIAAFALAWGPVPFLITSEVFNITIRGKGMTLSSLVMNLVSLGVVTSFLHLHDAVGGYVFLLYAASTVASSFFVWKHVPETRNVPLDRIDALLSKASGPTATSSARSNSTAASRRRTEVKNGSGILP